jgi:uncharacterized protein (UPF0548 family)
MFYLRRPDEHQIFNYLAGQVDREFSYKSVGCTRDHATTTAQLAGWNVDRHRVLLGSGAETFHQARAAIESWRMFPAEITSVVGCQKPRQGLDVAVLFDASPFPLWLLMPARVVYLVDDSATDDGKRIDRFGFAYGTLPDHIECGEERFLVEWNRDDDRVHYDVLAISHPRHWLTRLAYPYTRFQQDRFRRLSGLAMQRAITAEPPQLA